MVSMGRTYDEPVKVYSKPGGLLGTARFVGTARKNPGGGLWSWSGQLFNTGFDPGEVWEAREVRLEFEDGASGYVLISNVEIGSRSSRIELVGNGVLLQSLSVVWNAA